MSDNEDVTRRRLYWHSRRGMWELDLLLMPFLEEATAGTPDDFDDLCRRVRSALKAKSGVRPRLSVHRTSKHIYAQIINDESGVTLASASTQDKGLKLKGHLGNKAAATKIGEEIAKRAKAAGVEHLLEVLTHFLKSLLLTFRCPGMVAM